jgi:hypothetical protein
MQERAFSKTGWPELCPVKFYIPGGFLVVMPYARPLTFEEWRAFNYRDFVSRGDSELASLFDHYAPNWRRDEAWQPLHHLERGEAAPGGGLVPALYFRDSFGVFEGRIVAIDYG